MDNYNSVSTSIHEFLHKYENGYFTIVGSSRKETTAILLRYAKENPNIIYYNTKIEGNNNFDSFIVDIYTQLLNQYSNIKQEYGEDLPDNVGEGSWFLSLILQKISDYLNPDQKVIIAIDAIDAIDSNSQPPTANLFYLPVYLPQNVYFILTRKPFKKGTYRLFVQTPTQLLFLNELPKA